MLTTTETLDESLFSQKSKYISPVIGFAAGAALFPLLIGFDLIISPDAFRVAFAGPKIIYPLNIPLILVMAAAAGLLLSGIYMTASGKLKIFWRPFGLFRVDTYLMLPLCTLSGWLIRGSVGLTWHEQMGLFQYPLNTMERIFPAVQLYLRQEYFVWVYGSVVGLLSGGLTAIALAIRLTLRRPTD